MQGKADDELISDLMQCAEDKTHKKEVKSREKTLARKKRKNKAQMEQKLQRKMANLNEEDDSTRYLELPTPEEVKASYDAFRTATSSAALSLSICGVCAWQRLDQEVGITTVPLTNIPNAHRLVPRVPHAAHDIYEGGILLSPEGVVDIGKDTPDVQICAECMKELRKTVDRPPEHSLANDLWVGKVPWQLAVLTVPEQLLIAHAHPCAYVYKLYPKHLGRQVDDSTYQRGIRGNVTTYALDTGGMADMVMGRLLPRPRSILPSLISIVFIGRGKLPKSHLRNLFKVRREVIRDALEWLKVNNPKYYGDITIDEEIMHSLHEDDIPMELIDVVRHSEDVGIVEEERAGYVNEDDEGDNQLKVPTTCTDNQPLLQRVTILPWSAKPGPANLQK